MTDQKNMATNYNINNTNFELTLASNETIITEGQLGALLGICNAERNGCKSLKKL